MWSDAGSPLMVHTKNQAQALRAQLQMRHGDDVVVEFAMRYGGPAVKDVLQRMLEQGVRKLMVLPLYPQYSGSTTRVYIRRPGDGLQPAPLAARIGVSSVITTITLLTSRHWRGACRSTNPVTAPLTSLIFSYHGTPRSYLDQGDPYHCQCHATSRLVAETLGLREDDYLTTFQSRFGRAEWLRPYTDETLRELAAAGTKSVQLLCPGFAADCLETVEEIDVENRAYFLEAGGQSFQYIPCLNDAPAHIEALADIADPQLTEWLARSSDPAATRSRAIAMGADQ